jgi:long-chain acyl-CoA synthetase
MPHVTGSAPVANAPRALIFRLRHKAGHETTRPPLASAGGLRQDAPAMAERSTLQSLMARVAARGEAPALIAFRGDGAATLTYAQLAEHAARLAGGLLAKGVCAGDPVAVMAHNGPEAVIARLALIGLGTVLVSLDRELSETQLRDQLAESEARLMFTDAELCPAVRRVARQPIEIYTLDAPVEDAPFWDSLLAAPPAELPAREPDDVLAVFYTSGTTGQPKPVPLTHANIAGNLTAILELGVLAAGDRILVPLPLYHSYPLIVGMLAPLSAGATMVLPAGISGPEILRALREGEVAVIVGVPRLYQAVCDGIRSRAAASGVVAATLFRALLGISIAARRRLGLRLGRVLLRSVRRAMAPRLRTLASGGAKLRADVAWTLEGLGWEVLNGYGLVETTSIATFNPRKGNRPDTVGKAGPGTEIRIDSPDAEGRGEVLIRGPNVFRGYRNNPAANAAAFTADGWFRSGDLGVLDADGYLDIVGRVKEMVVLAGGKKVAPEEVEKVYAESPYVREIAVLERDESLVGLVVPELAAVEGAASARIRDLVRVSLGELSQQLPRWQRLVDFVIVREPLPRTHLGKYQRFKLGAIYANARRGVPPPATELSAADLALLERERPRQVWTWLQTKFPAQRLDPGMNPQLDLGIDSLGWVNLGMEMESRFGLRLSEEKLAGIMTLRDLLQVVDAAPAAEAVGEGPRPSVEEAKARWLQPPQGALRVAGSVLHPLLQLIAKLYFRLGVDGRERVPTQGPLIIAANHASDLDPFVVGTALSTAQLRQIWWGGDAVRLFTSRAGRLLARIAQIFPADDRAPGTTIELASEVLRRGRMLVWFPEEWRSPDGSLQPFLSGVGLLVDRSDAAVLPAYIDGTFAAMPRNRRVPRPHKVTVTFGAPIPAAALKRGLDDAAPADRHRRIAAALQDAVAALAGARGGSA